MPRPKKLVPSLLHHKASGRAKVRINGRDVYLGKWGSKEAKEGYARVVAELATGAMAAADVKRAAAKRSKGISVAELFAAWLAWARTHYVKNGQPTDELYVYQSPLRTARLLYGSISAAEFGPLALEAVRAELAKPYRSKHRRKPVQRSRSVINRYTRKLVAVFKWAASRELIPPTVPSALAMVAPIKAGRTSLPENKPVGPVSDETIAKTLPHLSTTLADMVRLGRVTGMRPGELVTIRPADIDRSGELWRYIPASHKTEHRDKSRVILIGAKGQSILAPYLDRPERSPCFPSAMNPDEPMGVGAFRQSIVRACGAAKVDPWHPNQLRHAFATEARSVGGIEAAAGLLGHGDVTTTSIYAARCEKLASDIAQRIG